MFSGHCRLHGSPLSLKLATTRSHQLQKQINGDSERERVAAKRDDAV